LSQVLQNFEEYIDIINQEFFLHQSIEALEIENKNLKRI